jgi:prepilin-type N-terminal cleavage/methylation domain-containing protein/prepilin-type processing-associated H-X9-DG protein
MNPTRQNTEDTIMKRNRSAFTLIELLVVIAIISLLVSILLPSLNKAKALARSAVCMTNQRSIGLAMQTYHGEYDAMLAPVNDIDGTTQPVVAHMVAKGYLDSTAYMHCPGFHEEGVRFSEGDMVEGSAGYYKLPTSGPAGYAGWWSYGSIGGIWDAYAYDHNIWLGWENGDPWFIMNGSGPTPETPSSEIYMMDTMSTGGIWMDEDTMKASMPTGGYGDPSATGQSYSTRFPDGSTGQMRWQGLSIRHGYRTNALFLDGHVEAVGGELFEDMNIGDSDNIWDGE